MRVIRGALLAFGVVAAVAIPLIAFRSSRQTTGEPGPGGSAKPEVWTCSMHPQIRMDKPGKCPICGMDLIKVAQPTPTEPARAATGGRTDQQVWTCSMHPQVRMDKPGQCPICGMDLIPAAQLPPAGGQAATGPVPPNLETAPITYRELVREVRAVGKLDYNERRVAVLAARIAGRVDHLYADFTGITVKQGDHLVDIYSPELYSAQNELILALGAAERARPDSRAIGRDYVQNNIEAARTKLLLWGITQEQLTEIERSRKVRTHLTIYAPIGGTVIEKAVRIGQYVNPGDVLYRIADLDPIWLYLDIYEYDIGWVRYGQAVDVTLEAFPGGTFQGTVTFIDPFLNDQTRTVRVRVNLPNPDRRLKPAMYAMASIRVRLRADGTPAPTGLEGKYWCPMHPEVVREQPGTCPICRMPLERVPLPQPAGPAPGGEHAGHEPAGRTAKPGQMLAIPASAVLDTGRRKITYRKTAGGSFELVEIEVGPRTEARDDAGRAAGFYPVLKGLREGDQVVVRGGFLLDSQRQIEGMPSLLYPEGRSAASLHAGHGGVPQPTTSPTGGHQH